MWMRSESGRLLLTGADRRSYLQGLLTNDIEALGPGMGCYAALLTAQGRMVTDMRVAELGDAILMDLPAAVTDAVCAQLGRFIFSEDVQVTDVTKSRQEIGVYGPRGAEILSRVMGTAVGVLRLHESVRLTFDDGHVIVIASDLPGIAGFDLVVDAPSASSLRAALAAAGAEEATEDDTEAVRIESGIPRFGVDMDTDTIPLEAGIEDRAISRTKGCYVGQEVIIRVLDRGHGRVVRRLVGLDIDAEADVPAPGAHVRAGDREVGRITSAVVSPALGRPIALAYVHRDFTTPGTELTVSTAIPARVAALPFVAVGQHP